MILILYAVVILAYLSLVIELISFPVPSVASTYQLGYQATESDKKTEEHEKLGSIKKWPFTKKVFFLFLPAVINVLVFIYPIGRVFAFDKMAIPLDLYSFNWSSIILGSLLVLIGRTITFSSVLNIRKNNQQKGNSFELKKKGLFNLSRNPGLIGMYLMIIGFFIIFPNLLFFLGILFYLGYMHFKVLLEEDFLKNHFGSPYIEYKNHTNRYI